MMSFTIAFSATWGPTVWVLSSEVLPLRVRGLGTALGTAARHGGAAGREPCALTTAPLLFPTGALAGGAPGHERLAQRERLARRAR
jgi:hypothetical protein